MATSSATGASRRRQVRLDERLPVDRRLGRVYRVGAAVMGVFFIVFGFLGLIERIGFFSTGGNTVLGLNSNGALSMLSILTVLLLLAGTITAGNTTSTVNIAVGTAFLLAGFASLALLDSRFNFLAFRIQNVAFSFVTGLLLVTFGMYGRVSGSLPHDNPYWRSRHPRRSS